jgi:hypothetical protein
MKIIILIATLFFVAVSGAYAQYEGNGSKLSESLADIRDNTREIRLNSGAIQGHLAIFEGWGEPADYSKYFTVLIIFQAVNTMLFLAILAERITKQLRCRREVAQAKGTAA